MEIYHMAPSKSPLVRDSLALPSGIKIALQMSADPTPEDFQLAHGLGVQYATAWIHDEQATPEDYAGRRAAFAAAGLTLYGLGNGAGRNEDDMVLNLPERDLKSEATNRHRRR